jgi:hypothetical protein
MAVLNTEVPDTGVNAVKALRYYWFIVIPVVLIARFFYYKYASPLRKYPGPFLASGSRAWKGSVHSTDSYQSLADPL